MRGIFVLASSSSVCDIQIVHSQYFFQKGGVVGNEMSFVNEAATFATRIVSVALQQLEKIQQNGNFRARYESSEIQGNDARGRQLVALDIVFDERVRVNATCQVHCVDGRWQYGMASILFLDETREYKKFHRNFCGRLNTENKLEVYEL